MRQLWLAARVCSEVADVSGDANAVRFNVDEDTFDDGAEKRTGQVKDRR